METFRSILVDVDATASGDPAFDAACDLAARLGASVTLVDVIEHLRSGARGAFTRTLEADVIARRRAALDVLARTRQDVPVNAFILRGQTPAALVRQVLRGNHQLLVRSHVRDRARDRSAGEIATLLLRTCPCAAWLVGPGPACRPSRILAAVDSEAVGRRGVELNQRVLDAALTLGEAWRASVTVLHAWSLFGEQLLRPHLTEEARHAALGAAEREAVEGLAAFVAAFGERAGAVRTVCLKGQAGYVIPRYATEHGIDVVVVGSAGRKGIGRLLMGDTAAAVLSELRGSMMAVRPPRLVTPVADAAHTTLTAIA